MYRVLADGNGGTTLVLLETNSRECKYVPPLPVEKLPVQWDNVALLLHGDSLTQEVSKYRRPFNTVQLTSEPNAFNTGSGFRFSTSTQRAFVNGDAALNIGTKAFCFEVRVKVTFLNTNLNVIITNRYTVTHPETYWTCFISSEGLFLVFGKQPGEYTNINWPWPNNSFDLNQDVPIAIQRDSDGVIKAYMNGRQLIDYKVAGPGTSPTYGPITSVPLINKSDFGSTIQTLGIGQGSAGSAFIGLIGEIRLVIGQHRFLLDQYVTDSTPFPES